MALLLLTDRLSLRMSYAQMYGQCWPDGDDNASSANGGTGDPPVDHGLEVFAVLGFLPVAGDLVAVLSCDIGPLVMKLGSQASPWPLQALVSFCRSPASELSTYSRRCRSEWKGSH